MGPKSKLQTIIEVTRKIPCQYCQEILQIKDYDNHLKTCVNFGKHKQCQFCPFKYVEEDDWKQHATTFHKREQQPKDNIDLENLFHQVKQNMGLNNKETEDKQMQPGELSMPSKDSIIIDQSKLKTKKSSRVIASNTK